MPWRQEDLRWTESWGVHNYAWEISPPASLLVKSKKDWITSGMRFMDQPCTTSVRRKKIYNRRKEKRDNWIKVLLKWTNCLQALETARNNVQRCNRPCANEYWPEICASIHSAVETGIIKIIQDRAQQMERWVEHDYSELSARENMVSLEALNAIECLPVL